MKSTIKAMFAAVAVTGLLAGCATYDYGYGYRYDQPYYGYSYDQPYYGYGYGPSYYDYGAYPYYYGAPSIGFDFRYRNNDRRYRSDRGNFDHRGRNFAQHHDSGGRQHANAGGARPSNARTHQPSRANTMAGNRVPAAPAPQRASSGSRRAAQSTMRAEQ